MKVLIYAFTSLFSSFVFCITIELQTIFIYVIVCSYLFLITIGLPQENILHFYQKQETSWAEVILLDRDAVDLFNNLNWLNNNF